MKKKNNIVLIILLALTTTFSLKADLIVGGEYKSYQDFCSSGWLKNSGENSFHVQQLYQDSKVKFILNTPGGGDYETNGALKTKSLLSSGDLQCEMNIHVPFSDDNISIKNKTVFNLVQINPEIPFPIYKEYAAKNQYLLKFMASNVRFKLKSNDGIFLNISCQNSNTSGRFIVTEESLLKDAYIKSKSGELAQVQGLPILIPELRNRPNVVYESSDMSLPALTNAIGEYFDIAVVKEAAIAKKETFSASIFKAMNLSLDSRKLLDLFEEDKVCSPNGLKNFAN